MTKLKVCCISSIEEAMLAIELKADALGLVGKMPSGPGVITDEQAREIARNIPPPVATFLLTAEEKASAIIDHVRYCESSVVQIVRHIDPAEYPTIIKGLPGIKRVQVIHVEDEESLALIPEYEPYVHAFLLDSGRPNESIAELGGTGRTHNWDISKRIVKSTRTPVFLAGGLTSENVSMAVKHVQPFGVDLCSGVRSEKQLDRNKLAAFVGTLNRNR